MPSAPPSARDEDFASKYTKAGPVASWLIDRFFDGVADLACRVAPAEVLEVGCGEGFSTIRLARILGPRVHLAAGDVDPRLAARARARNPGVPIAVESAYDLRRPDGSFDLVVCLEVLEHLDDPARALAELCRVARRAVLVSVPREPLWRVLNVARGRYLRAAGNTPGHVQHWSSRGFVRFVGRQAEVLAVRTPVPWTQVLARPRLAAGAREPVA